MSGPIGRLGALFGALLFCLLAGACASSSAQEGVRPAVGAPPTLMGPAPPVAPLADYRIGPLDRVNLTVFQVPSLSQQRVQVDSSGQLTLPLIGRVVAAGKTTSELSAEIASRLGKEYLESPQVTVWVDEAVSRAITVDGSVVQPGVYPIAGPTTLVQAVAMARGPELKYANLNRVAVFRTTDGQRTVAVFDLKAIRRGRSEDPVILPNDVVVVDGSELKGAWRELITTLPSLAVFRFF